MIKNGLFIDKENNKRYYKNDLLHREDGPAIELANGSKEWYQNGKRHRLDGPVIENSKDPKYFGKNIWSIYGITLNLSDCKTEKNLEQFKIFISNCLKTIER